MDNIIIKILFLLLLHQQLINCFQHEQDILLTPNRTHLNRHKIILYQPNNINFIHNKKSNNNIENHQQENNNKNNELLSSPLWLEPLKHTMILTLQNENQKHHHHQQQQQQQQHDNIYNKSIQHENNNKENEEEEKILMKNLLKSIFIPINNYNYTNFGDIIMLGKGILEFLDNNKQYIFKQKINISCQRNNICITNDNNNNDKNIKAIWTVEKLRHKQQNNYNYELKITIYPFNNNNNNKTSKRYSFLLKQNDYPQYFNDNLIKKANNNKILTATTTMTSTIDNKNDNNNNNDDDQEQHFIINKEQQIKYDKSSIDRTIFGGLFDFYKRPYMLNEVPFHLNAFHTQKPYRHIFPQKPDLNVGEYFTNLHPEHDILHQPQPHFQQHLLHQNHLQQQQHHQLLDTTTTDTFLNHNQQHFLTHPQATTLKNQFPFYNNKIKFPEHEQFNFKNHYEPIETQKQPNIVTHFHRHLILNPPNKIQVIKPTGNKYNNNQHTHAGLKFVQDNPHHPTFTVTNQYAIEEDKRSKLVEQSLHHQQQHQPQHHPLTFENHPQSHQTIYHNKIPAIPAHGIQQHYQLNDSPVSAPLQIPIPSTQEHLVPHKSKYQPQPEYLQDPRETPVTTIQYTQQLQSPPYISSTLYKHVPQTTAKYNLENTEAYHPQHEHEEDYQVHNHQAYHLQQHQDTNNYPQNQIQQQQLTNHSPQIENYHFSEPDPLYHGQLEHTETDQPQQSFLINVDGNYEEHSPKPHAVSQIETPNNYPHHNDEEQEVRTFSRYPEFETTSTKYQQHIATEKYNYSHDEEKGFPDSINAQLPPPEKDSEIAIPYVATSNKKSISTPHFETSEITSTVSDATSSTTPTVTSTSKRNATIQKRPYTRRIAEKPVIKWMPKKSYRSTTTTTTTTPTYDLEFKAESSSSTYQSINNSNKTHFTENYITVTPTTIKFNQSPITQQSVSTSITYEIGDAQIIDNLLPTLKSTNSVEMVKANIEAIQTNTTNIEAYRATSDENKEKKEKSKNYDQLTESILNHAKTVTLE